MESTMLSAVPVGNNSWFENSTDITEEDREYALYQLNNKMVNAVMPVTVFVGMEAVLGFLGNIMVIYVFMFHYKQCNFRYFVLSLAVTDLISSLTTMPGEVITQLNWYTYPYPLLCKVKSFFNVFTVSAEALALVTIAVDRYLKVCWPFGFQISTRIAKYLVVLIYIVATIIAFPVAIYWGTHTATEWYMNMNVTVTVCEQDQEFVGTPMPLRYSLSIEGIIGATLVIMFVLYLLVARRLLLNKSSTNIKISEPLSKTTISGEGIHANEEKSDTARITKSPDSAYSSAASSSGTATAIHNKGYISDEGLSSSDIDVAVSDSPGRKKRHNVVRSKTTRGVGRNVANRGRLRRKTMIMVILTVAFIITTVQYLTLLSFIAKGVLRNLSDTQKAVYFFFFRFYFINHVINPIIYGLLDPTFKKVLRGCRQGTMKTSTGTSSSHEL